MHVDGGELVGTLDKGWHELLDVLDTERIGPRPAWWGRGRCALRRAIYANERRVFGEANSHI